MSTFSLELVTPTKVLDEGQVEHIRCPGLDGYFGVMANHRDAIIALGIGEVKVTQNKRITILQLVVVLLKSLKEQ